MRDGEVRFTLAVGGTITIARKRQPDVAASPPAIRQRKPTGRHVGRSGNKKAGTKRPAIGTRASANTSGSDLTMGLGPCEIAEPDKWSAPNEETCFFCR